MQKKSRRILSAVVTALFMLSISYFALLAPTTAWFYQEIDDQQTYTFSFGDFKMTEVERGNQNLTIPLRAATRFADAGELLFDEVIHVVKVDVQNLGGIRGQVAVNVTQNENNPTGLRWFVYETAANAEIPDVSASAVASKGAYKTAIETMLTDNNFILLNYKTNYSAINALSGATYDAKYESYNANAINLLNAHNAKKIVLEPNEQKVVYVAFWAEFGEVSGLSSTSVTNLTYNVSLEFEGTPYNPEAQTLRIVNDYNVSIQLALYLDGSTTPYGGTYTAIIGSAHTQYTIVDGVISAFANRTIVLDIPTGTPFRLEITSQGEPVHLENVTGGIGTISGLTNRTITDTISNQGNEIHIVANT